MARTKSTARKSRGGGRGGCRSNSSSRDRGSRRSLHPAQEVDFLSLFANWLVTLISKLATQLVESDASWLEWFPFLSSLSVPKAPHNEVIRTISASLDCTGDQETNDHNLLLQEAVSAFIAKNFTFEASKMFYELEEDPNFQVSSNEYGDDDNYPSASLSPKLARPNSQWLKLTPEIGFKYATAGLDIYYQFRSSHPNGSDKIDAFVTNAFELHQQLEAQRIKEEKERYHFKRLENGSFKQPARNSGRGIRGRGRGRASRKRLATRPQSMQVCKRYRLTDSTTFASLFFEGKAQLIQTLDDFHRRVGKFAPRKFAHRIGIFLHGPSGTGKTSIAKAIAHHTNRHIVNVDANQIKTNKEMADLLQDFNYSVPSLGLTVELDFNDVVLVLEGVDEICFTSDEKSQSGQRSSLYAGVPKIVSEEEADALSVHGFLSALDGMVDTPGRMIVMTANSKDRVAPELIRPGRVHATFDLGAMTSECTQGMIEHYLDTKLDPEQVGNLQSIFHAEAAVIGAMFTPAEMEAICLESQDLDSVLRELSSCAQ